MSLSESERTFIEQHPHGAFITVGPDSVPKAIRFTAVFVEGKLWSSSTQTRVRTKRLRNDPRCTLFFFDASPLWLTVEANVRIFDGPEAPDLNVRLFRELQGRPTGDLWWFDGERNEEDFRTLMVEEQRLVYEIDVTRTYGMVEPLGPSPPPPPSAAHA